MSKKYTRDDLICIHNNLAKRHGLPQIPYGTRIPYNELVDKIEAVNNYKPPAKPVKVNYTKIETVRDIASIVKAGWNWMGTINVDLENKRIYKKPLLTTTTP